MNARATRPPDSASVPGLSAGALVAAEPVAGLGQHGIHIVRLDVRQEGLIKKAKEKR